LRLISIFWILFSSAVVGLTSPAIVLADCAANVEYVRSVSDAVGVTFRGRLSSVDPAAVVGWRLMRFEVERSFAGDVGRQVTVRADACHLIDRMRVGRRYLVSSADLHAASAPNTVAWTIDEGNRVKLVAFDGEASVYPFALRNARTVHDAVGLMVLDRGGDLPATSTTNVVAASGGLHVGLPALIGVTVGCLIALVFARRACRPLP
jgi:hypothetical protein